MNAYHVIIGAFVACDGSDIDDTEREDVIDQLVKLGHRAPGDAMGSGDCFIPEDSPLCKDFDPRDDVDVGDAFTSDDVRLAVKQLEEECADEIAILKRAYGRDEVTLRWGYFICVG